MTPNKEVKICLIGSELYENRGRIKETIWKLKGKFNEDLHILGGGGTVGANKYIKKYAIEFGVKYTEYNPAYTNYNLYSALNENYYGKPFHATHIHHRNDMLCKASNAMLIFSPINKPLDKLEPLHNKMKKLQKNVVIMN